MGELSSPGCSCAFKCGWLLWIAVPCWWNYLPRHCLQYHVSTDFICRGWLGFCYCLSSALWAIEVTTIPSACVASGWYGSPGKLHRWTLLYLFGSYQSGSLSISCRYRIHAHVSPSFFGSIPDAHYFEVSQRYRSRCLDHNAFYFRRELVFLH